MTTIIGRERKRPLKAFSSLGFTIVELLIVIVIIGILAAIVIVAYNGITTSANRAMVASEAKEWAKLFELYRAKNGHFPNLADGYYCLGTGFPENECRQPGHATYGYDESTGASVITALSEVGSPPRNSRKWEVGPYVGPYLYVTTSNFYIYTFIQGDNTAECGKVGLTHSWMTTSGNPYILCQLQLRR